MENKLTASPDTDSKPCAENAAEVKVSKQVTIKEESSGNPFSEVEPWAEPIVPEELLSEIASSIQRFVVCSDETAYAAALWIAMTWFMEEVQIAPLAVITAPEKRCGKTQMLTVLGRLCCRPLMASNITPAALFRSIDAWHPTLLIDEADTFMKENEELRGLINSGHTRDLAYSVRVVGKDPAPKCFDTWSAKAISGIGHLQDTLMDRAIIFELRRKLPTEVIERLRYAPPELWETLNRKLARFARDFSGRVSEARPILPRELNDRAQDNWEPLLQIAAVAGGVWPSRARHAALKLSKQESQPRTVGVELLADIEAVFDDRKAGKLFTADLIMALCKDRERPWATYNNGTEITPRQLAKLVRLYGISSNSIRIQKDSFKGYSRSQFEDAFARYVHGPENKPSGVTRSHAMVGAASRVTPAAFVSADAVTSDSPVTAEVSLRAECDGVTENAPDAEGIDEEEIEI